MPIIFGMSCRDIRYESRSIPPATACRGLASGEASAWARLVQSRVDTGVGTPTAHFSDPKPQVIESTQPVVTVDTQAVTHKV